MLLTQKYIDKDCLLALIFNIINRQLSFSDKKHLIDVLKNTTMDNWKKAFDIVIFEECDLRLWQAVAEVDYTFPAYIWGIYGVSNQYIPRNIDIIRALDKVVMVYASGKIMQN